MRILAISAHFPANPPLAVHGVFQRQRVFLEALQGLGSLEVLYFCPPTAEVDIVAETMPGLLADCWGINAHIRLAPLSDQRRRSTILADLAYNLGVLMGGRGIWGTATASAIGAVSETIISSKPDLIFAHRLSAMYPLLHLNHRLPPIFLDLDDIEHLKLSRSISLPPMWLTKRLLYLQVLGLYFDELRALSQATKTFVCSQEDKKVFGRYANSKIDVIPNSVILPTLPAPNTNAVVLFVGTFTYEPNVSAADFLVMHIWPDIQALLPNAHLLIVGAQPERLKCRANPPRNVTFLGFVDDLHSVYERATVVCCPILSGSGTRIKILEAAAHAKAVVATPIAAEGLPFTDGTEIFIRETPAAIAETCIWLLQNAEAAHRVGKAARDVVRRRFDRSMIINDVRRRISEHIRDHAGVFANKGDAPR